MTFWDFYGWLYRNAKLWNVHLQVTGGLMVGSIIGLAVSRPEDRQTNLEWNILTLIGVNALVTVAALIGARVKWNELLKEKHEDHRRAEEERRSRGP